MADLIIKIGASSKQFQEELDVIKGQTEDLRSQLESVGKSAAIVFTALTAAVGASIKAFADQEKIANQTNAILKATGSIAGVTAKEVNSMAHALSESTAFNKEAIVEGENVLLTFTHLGKEVFPQATQATLDLATRMGTDAAGAAQILGKALQNPAEGMNLLRRSGIELSEIQKKQIQQMVAVNDVAGAQKLILDQVNSSIGGLSQASAQGVSGSFARLKNTFEDLAQDFGAQFAPAVKEAADKVRELLVLFKNNESAVSAFATAIKVAIIGSGALAALSALGAAMAYLPVVATAVTAALTSAFFPLVAAAAGVAVLVSAGKDLLDLSKKRASGRDEGLTDSKRADDAKFTNERIENENRKHLETIRRQNEDHNTQVRQLEILQLNDSLLEYSNYGEEYISLLQKYHANELAILNEQDAAKKELRLLAREEIGQELSAQYEEDQLALIAFEESLAQTEDQYHLQKMDRRSKAYLALQKEAQKNYKTEEKLQQEFAKKQFLQEQSNRQADYEDALKYGKFHSDLRKLLRDTEVGQALTYFGTMQNLQRSHNETLKSIGKAAAVTQITIDTARTAMEAYSALASIPYVGPVLGAAAAAAVIAFGAEQIGTVLGAQEGGVFQGGIANVDSIPALYTPGELVVPTQSYEEVVTAVADKRNNVGGEGGSGGEVRVVIEMNENAAQIITAQQVENRRLGLSTDGLS